jgi:hypothetical protein
VWGERRGKGAADRAIRPGTVREPPATLRNTRTWVGRGEPGRAEVVAAEQP